MYKVPKYTSDFKERSGLVRLYIIKNEYNIIPLLHWARGLPRIVPPSRTVGPAGREVTPLWGRVVAV